MLLDELLITPGSEQFTRELLALGAILFTLKFERDFNNNLRELFIFIGNKLRFSPSDLFRVECFILQAVPANFGQWVGFSELLTSLICVSELHSVLREEREFLGSAVTEAYIRGESTLSVDNLFVGPLSRAFFPEKQRGKKREEISRQIRKFQQSDGGTNASSRGVQFKSPPKKSTGCETFNV